MLYAFTVSRPDKKANPQMLHEVNKAFCDSKSLLTVMWVLESGEHNGLHYHAVVAGKKGIRRTMFKVPGYSCRLEPLLTQCDVERWSNYLSKHQKPHITEKDNSDPDIDSSEDFLSDLDL